MPASHKTLSSRATSAGVGGARADGKSDSKAIKKPALKPRQILERARQNQQIAEELAKGLSMPEIQGIAVSGLVDGELCLLANGGEAVSLIRFHRDSIVEHLTASGFAVDRIKVRTAYVQTPTFAPLPVLQRQPMSEELRRSTLALARRCSSPRLAALWRKLANSRVVTPADEPAPRSRP